MRHTIRLCFCPALAVLPRGKQKSEHIVDLQFPSQCKETCLISMHHPPFEVRLPAQATRGAMLFARMSAGRRDPAMLDACAPDMDGAGE
jgi:hypothetical protein